MTLNLNESENFTIERVRQFIASCDDSVHRQIRVTDGGIVFISDTVGASHTEGIAFCLESFIAGNDYFGAKASRDDKWVGRIHAALKNNWPHPSSPYIDAF